MRSAWPIVFGSWRSAAIKPGGRLVVVCMARGGGGGRALKMYEYLHQAFPKTVDCRPIDAAPLLEAAGFEVRSVEARSVAGLPVEVVVAGVAK